MWRSAYRFDGKQKLLALGVYPTVPLARARQARQGARRLLADGLDPALKKTPGAGQTDAPTLRGIADEYVAKLRREERSEATMAKIEWLLGFANAEFGDEPIGQISAPAILRVLRSLESRERYESARRLRSTIGSVFRYAIATARAEFDPTDAPRGALRQVKAMPRAAITDARKFGAMFRVIDAFDGQPGTRTEAKTLIADKAFDADERVIRPLAAAGENAVIPQKANRKKPRKFDRHLYAARHLIENFFAKPGSFEQPPSAMKRPHETSSSRSTCHQRHLA